jgi:hypothetical protein
MSRLMRLGVHIAIALLTGVPALAEERPQEAIAHFAGSDFAGGANDLYGSVFDGQQVNYVYAEPTGSRSVMQVKFSLEVIPAGEQSVYLKGRDDDFHMHCPIAVALNGKTIFEGSNKFSHPGWQTQRIAIPPDVLKRGENVLAISNRAREGKIGMPPWVQVADCVIGPEKYVIRRDLTKDFWVTLPEKVRPLPEPLPEGKQPGFKWRGIKGWMWKPEQYLSEIPVLAKFKMNFLMNCYTSMCDVEHYRWGDPNVNRWWEELPAAKKKAYEAVVRESGKNGIQFCFSMNPNLCSKRFVNSGRPEDIDALWQHYAWMQGLGVKWFNISLDDITQGVDAAGQAKVVNEILRRLRAKDPEARMIFCPTYYWGDGTGKDQKPYLEILARELDKDVYLFWTGDSVVGRITRKAADTFHGIARHRMFLWDNYPVNDARPTMHLGPVIGRDRDLCEVIDGYMSNSMCQQNEANRIPMLTCADYAWNPFHYDPERSIGQAIVHLAESEVQREVLRDLVETYSGMLIYGLQKTGFNAVRDQYGRIMAMPHARQAAEGYIEHLERLSSRLKEAFPDSYRAEKKTLDDDLQLLRQKFSARYGDAAVPQETAVTK